MFKLETRLIDTLGIASPVILAPMAGSSNAEIAINMTRAGGLGSVGAAAFSVSQLLDLCAELETNCPGSYNINLFSSSTESLLGTRRMSLTLRQQLETYHETLGLKELPEPVAMFGPADKQLDVLLESATPVISFHFGVDAKTVSKIHAAGKVVLCSATTVKEARFLESIGVDAIIAQGSEAGGHRGSFLHDYRSGMTGLMALLPAICQAVTTPVIAAGGIADARGVAAALVLGAQAVQMGTAFLTCPEVPIADAWREALVAESSDSLTVTTAVSGKAARGIKNRYIEALEPLESGFLPYPYHYSVSRELRARAAKTGNKDFMVMWAGQGIDQLSERDLGVSIESKVRHIMDELKTLIEL